MKYQFKTFIYWSSPLLVAFLLICIYMFFISDKDSFKDYPGPRAPDEIVRLILLLILGLFVIIGYISCTLYKVFKYHSSVLVITFLVFFAIEILQDLPIVLKYNYQQKNAVINLIYGVLRGTLIWTFYPLLLCPLLYMTRKRKNKDETDSDSEENPISPQTEEMEKTESIYNRTTVDINNEK